MTGSTEKRLLKYATLFKRGIILGIICLMISTALELAGPFIAKIIIDDHILGVEGTWHQVEDMKKDAVRYKDRSFIREERLINEIESVGEVTVIAIDEDYYFVDEKVPLQGKRMFENGVLTIGTDDPIQVNADKLTLDELYHFFKPEQKPILLLLGLYIGLLLIAGVFQYYQTYLLQQSSNQIVKKMRNDIFLHT